MGNREGRKRARRQLRQDKAVVKVDVATIPRVDLCLEGVVFNGVVRSGQIISVINNVNVPELSAGKPCIVTNSLNSYEGIVTQKTAKRSYLRIGETYQGGDGI